MQITDRMLYLAADAISRYQISPFFSSSLFISLIIASVGM